ncbi:xanthine dehydrogenase family protein molybdopterin-binding subunit [Salinisphaera sp. Q1T1-3]|uniref:xanthine dehydrogenase family protein molybdopterin-binding subunit n=1 Tax=Salinisphaera sp. Q1T1-3 TaxID=2321229 RepID=UPI000E75674A|nr:xanthine dehydrogenase family protein molybdopterin-binding subunit [Salinisphaera sp. Q1T1-3]RJS95219.1 xanthine dehydrogenase family protein molybdopterin-binding subunit [Salinisphaera sp. Q1T1-3]
MSTATIGTAVPRVEGIDKLTGRARYAADFHPEGMAYGYGVYSTISRGRVVSIDTEQAQQMPGVIEIFHHDNFPELHRSPASFPEENMVDELRTPFEDDVVHYAGQFVAFVVAETFEQARNAAYRVRVDYDAESAAATLADGRARGTTEANRNERGDADAGFSSAEVTVDATYTTPVETHNPMELHATTAYWRDGRLVVHESTQGVIFARNTLAKNFDLDPSQIEIHADFIGSGFGGKLWLWPHCLATCAASRELGRPVQFMLPRQYMFTTSGHRPETSQHLRLGATRQGVLTSIMHESINSTSSINTFVEACGGSTASLYACDNLRVTHATAVVDRGTPTPMRAPGAGVGLFALESAMDELAIALDMDPLALRRKNFTEVDPDGGKPFSSNHMLECYDRAAERFGWADRDPAIGSMRDGDEILGWGLAACNWDAMRNPCDARVTLRPDGSATVHCATQDIGTGTYTIIAQTAADTLGIDIDRVHVAIGDSTFPHGQISGGSWATASILPAVIGACKAASDRLIEYAVKDGAPMAGANGDDLIYEAGVVKNGQGDQASAKAILKPLSLPSAVGDFHSDGATEPGYSYGSFGVHFVEIGWAPDIARLRARRVVSAVDAGAIINDRTARNQVEGAIVMGLGSALFEATEYDERTARPVNNNYAEYLVPVNADMPDLDVILLDHPDYKLNELGARGIGEIGLTGIQAAVANAVHHATGKRIRDLPIMLDKLMETS